MDLTGTGRPVDAYIMPSAPFSAARPMQYKYYGYTMIINLLDYTACTVPVTYADKNVDTVVKDFKPLSELDQTIMDSCESHLFVLASD